jgi:hypothetical protein
VEDLRANERTISDREEKAMAKYVLTSAVLTSHGVWEYRPATISEVKRWLQNGGWISAVKYPATVEVIKRLTGVQVPLSNRRVVLTPGDEALVFRLRHEAASGPRFIPSLDKVARRPDLQKKYIEFGFLRLVQPLSRREGS